MTILGMTPYQMAWYFVIYSFGGWVIEVIFHAVTQGKIINRGFLNGPVCPVYGFGVLSVFAMGSLAGRTGTVAVENLPVWKLFAGGVVLATAVELIAGWLLNRLFHARWWDYSDRPFNYHGYICLEFSLIWGMAIAFVVREIQPTVRSISDTLIPERYGWPILSVLYAVYLADLIITVLTVLRFNRRLEELDRMRASMRTVSDGMSRIIGGGTVKTMESIERGKVRVEAAGEGLRTAVAGAEESLHAGVQGARTRLQDRRTSVTENVMAQYAELQRRQEELYHALQKEKYFGTGRLLRAFPEMRHSRFNETLAWIQEKLGRDNESK